MVVIVVVSVLNNVVVMGIVFVVVDLSRIVKLCLLFKFTTVAVVVVIGVFVMFIEEKEKLVIVVVIAGVEVKLVV